LNPIVPTDNNGVINVIPTYKIMRVTTSNHIANAFIGEVNSPTPTASNERTINDNVFFLKILLEIILYESHKVSFR
jgi:hypothetical protein